MLQIRCPFCKAEMAAGNLRPGSHIICFSCQTPLEVPSPPPVRPPVAEIVYQPDQPPPPPIRSRGAFQRRPDPPRYEPDPEPAYSESRDSQPDDDWEEQQSLREANRQKVAAGCLALFLGGIGVHKFYLGQPVGGLIHVAIFLVGLPCAFIGPAISGVIAGVEGVLYLTRTDEEFRAAYLSGSPRLFF